MVGVRSQVPGYLQELMRRSNKGSRVFDLDSDINIFSLFVIHLLLRLFFFTSDTHSLIVSSIARPRCRVSHAGSQSRTRLTAAMRL